MDLPIAHTLAADMIARLRYCDDFFKTVDEFDFQRSNFEEYSYALKAAAAARVPFENRDWRIKVLSFIEEKLRV